jgi:hypothetical protein
LGKHFAVEGGNLYIFTTGTDVMLNLNSFPKELDLFEADTSWRVSPWVAVVEDVLQRQLDSAMIVLRLHGYEKASLPQGALESYFVDGRESIIIEMLLAGRLPAPVITLDTSDDS